jgi:hypothetical protein
MFIILVSTLLDRTHKNISTRFCWEMPRINKAALKLRIRSWSDEDQIIHRVQ